jgi:Inner membrane protein YgaP-like, transmembrane domain
MKKNLGTTDRVIRIIAALIIGALLYTGTLEGAFGTIIGIIAIVLLLTSALSFCPLYFLFRISTLPKIEGKK